MPCEIAMQECDCGWNDYFFDGTELTLVAHFDVPGDIVIQRRPPESIGNSTMSRINPFVAKLVVSSFQNAKSIRGK